MNSCISCQTNVSKENLIPQLDGNGQVECENCERNFKTEEELKKHMEEHEWAVMTVDFVSLQSISRTYTS